jgi:hypothetical protein
MPLNIRQPTGTVPWPCILLAGTKGAGKSYTAVEASNSILVDRAYVLTLGEEVPDDLALIPGANFSIVEHDGTYDSILEQVTEVAALASLKTPHLFVFDGATALWELIRNNRQAVANERAKQLALAQKRTIADSNAPLGNDDWDAINTDWYRVINTIRRMAGPTIITAKLEETERGWRVRAHQDLAYDVSAVVELPERGTFRLTKLKSAANPIAGTVDLGDFHVDNIWGDLGLHGSRPARELALPVRNAA